jgi:uncharacterized protein
MPEIETSMTTLSAVAAYFGFATTSTFLALVAAALLGGLVRGFTGFGFAMVFVPIATMTIGPVGAAGLIWLVDIPFAIPLAISSFKRVAWREVFPLLAGATVCVPLGVWLLTNLDPVVARWIVAISILVALAALVTGWRYKGAPSVPLSLGVGGLSGTASGMAQLGGMPVAIFWLAAQKNDPRQTKDNLNGYFALLPFVTGIAYWLSGVLSWAVFWQAIPLCVPYGLSMVLGAKLFPLASEQTFRRIAYLIIAVAAVVALPVMDQFLKR